MTPQPLCELLESRFLLSATTVGISGANFLINGRITDPGSRLQGLLPNVRAVNATFDDANAATMSKWAYPDTGKWDPQRNTNEFAAAIPTYRAQGLLAATLNFQGGRPVEGAGTADQPWINTAFNPDGSLKADYLGRMERAIRALDENGMVAIVGMFYFGQDQRLTDEAAVVRAVDNATDWLVSKNFTNVIVEINNEADLGYQHAILNPDRVPELINRVRTRSGGKLKVSTSLSGGKLPSDAIIAASDFVLLHGNNQSASTISSMVSSVRAKTSKPIVFNEDSTSVTDFDAAVAAGASWGYYDKGLNNYIDGFQSPAVNWSINTPEKKAFFSRVFALTQAPVPAPTPGPTPGPVPTPAPVPGTYEAESATIVGAKISALHGGFGGTGFVDYLNPSGDYVQWSAGVTTPGIYTLQFRYANGSTAARPLSISVNGAAVGIVQFAPTADWATWSTQSISVSLAAGANSIRATATGFSGANIDSLQVAAASPAPIPSPVPGPTPVLLSSVADSTVRDGSLSNTNSGTSPQLLVKEAIPGYDRQTYLKFDLSTVSTISRATLRLFGSLQTTVQSNIRTAAYAVADSAWGQNTITWNNKPAHGATPLAVVTVTDTTPRWYEWDLTSFIRLERAAGHRFVSIALQNLDRAYPLTIFNSQEAAANRPQLAIT